MEVIPIQLRSIISMGRLRQDFQGFKIFHDLIRPGFQGANYISLLQSIIFIAIEMQTKKI